ncbi:hypothetical protein ACXHRU_002302 [Listeria monocytogenes]
MQEPFYILFEKATPFGDIVEIGIDTTFDFSERESRLKAKVDKCKEELAKRGLLHGC